MSILNVNNLVPISGSLEVGSVVAAGCSAGNMTVSGNYNANGLVTLANGAILNSVSCSVAPTASQHLANKSYTDSVLNGSGKLVYFKAFTGSEILAWDYPTVPTTVFGSITNLPDGNYKLYAEAFYTISGSSGKAADSTSPYSQYARNQRTTISYTFSDYSGSEEMLSSFFRSGGGCGSIGVYGGSGAVGVLSQTISVTNNDITQFVVSAYRSDSTPNPSTFVVNAIKVYIFSA
jgi:hypothetical protein